MKYLLDTHTLIWTILESPRLSLKAADVISDKANQIYVSSITFWEICIKLGCGKLALGGLKSENLPTICKSWGFELLSLTPIQACTFCQITATHHKDPFDRMLIWQSICHDLVLITDDKNIGKYTPDGLKTVW